MVLYRHLYEMDHTSCFVVKMISMTNLSFFRCSGIGANGTGGFFVELEPIEYEPVSTILAYKISNNLIVKISS